MKWIVLGGVALALAGCATPYQEMGFTGGVAATQLSSDTFQVTARGNAYTDGDTIQRYVLRKAAEATLQAGRDYFVLSTPDDRSSVSRSSLAVASGNRRNVWANAFSFDTVKPGQTVTVKMYKGTMPENAPFGMFGAADVLKFAALSEATKDKRSCEVKGGVVVCEK